MYTRRKSKIISILLSLAILITLLPAAVYAADPPGDDGQNNGVCEIVETGIEYDTLSAALEAITDSAPKTIRLNDDVLLTYTGEGTVRPVLGITSRNITFDLNGHILDIKNTANPWLNYALQAIDSTVTFSGIGICNIENYRDDGLYAQNSTISLSGGAELHVTGAVNGVTANTNSNVTVTSVEQTADNGSAADARYSSEIYVLADVTSNNYGIYTDGSGSYVEVAGNVESDNHVGVHASDGAEAYIMGNVTGNSKGCEIVQGGEITIDGSLSAAGVYMDINAITYTAEDTTESGKAGYLAYGLGEGGATVWIKNGAALEVTDISVRTQPDDLDYTTGENLDLTGLVVTLEYNDGSSLDVGSEDFEVMGITTDPVSGTALTVLTHHGQPIVVSCNSQTASTDPLAVTVSVSTGAAVWNYRSPVPSPNIMENVKYIEGKFFAVGYNGTLIMSADGVAWQRVDIGTDVDRLCGIAYGNGKYVAVGFVDDYSGRIYTSDDGLNWHETAAVAHHWIHDVIYGDDEFVAVGQYGKILVSDDGEEWETITLPNMENQYTLTSVTYGNGIYVASGFGATSAEPEGGIMTSEDGENWVVRHNNSYYTLWDVTYGGGIFVCVGGANSGSYFISTSSDGVTWTQRSTGWSGYARLHSVEFDGSRFIAVGYTNGTNNAFVTTSTDGTNWSDKNSFNLAGFRAVASDASASRCVVMSGTGNIYTSDNGGTSWTYRTQGTTRNLRDIAWNGTDLYVAVGSGGTIQTSPDGETWTIRNSGTTHELNEVNYLNGQFITVGENGTILTSSDGETWIIQTSGTPRDLKGIAYGANKYVVVGGESYNDPVILTSGNGTDWSIQSPAGLINRSFITVAYGDGAFLALMQYGQAYRSSDGISWVRTADLPGSGTQYPTKLIHADGKFAAVCGYGKIFLSADPSHGGNWTFVQSDVVQDYILDIAYGDGKFIGVANNGKIIASADGGLTWYLQPSGLTPNPYFSLTDDAQLYGIAAGGDSFVAVGGNGVVIQSENFNISTDPDAHDVARAKAALFTNNILGSGSNEHPIRIVANMNLTTSWSYGTSISWTSSKPQYIATNGTVTRPPFGTGDQVVYLTATISKGAASDNKIFIVDVIEQPNPDISVVDAAFAALTFDVIKGDNTETNNIVSNLNLTTAGIIGTAVSWASSKPAYITTGGAVTRPAQGASDQEVTLTATISKGTVSRTKNFYLTVKSLVDPDVQAVADAKTGLTFNVIKGTNTAADNIVSNLNLITAGSSGTAISWASNKPAYITTGGAVTRPPHGSSDEVVTLTATISKGAASDTKLFTLTVKATEPADNVCEIVQTGFGYATLDLALAAVQDGQTIALLQNIDFEHGIIVDGKTIVLNLNGHTLNVTNGSGTGLDVKNSGSLQLFGSSGELNVTGNGYGVEVSGNSSSATVTNIVSSDTGAFVSSGGCLTVNGNVTAGAIGVYATGSGSHIAVNGNSTGGAGDSGMYYSEGARAFDSASVTVGNIILIGGINSFGARVMSFGTITVEGTITGPVIYISVDETSRTINDRIIPTSKPGYHTYKDLYSTVWVKGTDTSGVADITVTTQPDDLNYAAGEHLDLTGLIVTLTYNNSLTLDVGSEDFEVMDIATIPASGAALTVATHHGQPIIVNCNGLSASTNNLAVTASSAVSAVISPSNGFFNKNIFTADVNTIITWNDASAVTDVKKDDVSIGAAAYTVSENALTIHKEYLAAQSAGNLVLTIEFDAGNAAELTVTVIDDRPVAVASATPQTVTAGIAGPGNGTVTFRHDASYYTNQQHGVIIDYQWIFSVQNPLNPNFNAINWDGISPGHYSADGLAWHGSDPNAMPTHTYMTPGNYHAALRVIDNGSPFVTDITVLEITVNAPAPVGSGGGGGGGGGTSPNAPVTGGPNSIPSLPVNLDGRSGNAGINLTGSTAGTLFGNEGNTTINVPSISGVSSYTLGMPASALSGQEDGTLTFATELGNISIPGSMLTGQTELSGGEAGITIGEGDKSVLPDAVREALGGRPLLQFTFTLDGEQTEWNNPDAPVTVAIPYEPTEEELADPENIVVWYIDGAGNVVTIPNGRWDPVTETVVFSTTHFSYYAVAYVCKEFKDLSGYGWAEKPIEVMAAKGIINGTGDGIFSPKADITRADYLTLLVRTLGLTASFDSNFEDVARDSYFYESLGIARELGIASGGGNNRFRPKDTISRQDMMTLTARALEKCKGLRVTGDSMNDGLAQLNHYSDSDSIADYAAGSMAALIKEGLVTGYGVKITPLANTTRAEAAVLLYKVYNKYH